MADLSIMYQPIAGGWVKLGTQTGGGRGVNPESISLEGDRGEGGCLAASFKLKQDPRWINSEMQAFTPITVWDGAVCIWSGRTIMAPTTFGESDIEVVVQCQGWWQHLKDDCTDREWVISDLGRAIESRTTTDALLSIQSASIVTRSEGGALYLGVASGVPVTFSQRAGFHFDAGPNNLITRAVLVYTSSNNNGNLRIYASGMANTSMNGIGGADSTNFINNAGASGTRAWTFATPRRYLSLALHVDGSHTPAADAWFQFSQVILFMDTADESGNASILKASTVISETLDAIAPKISRDRSRITTTALNLPQFPGSPAWRYADELIKQANAPHGYITRLTPEPLPVFEFFPVPTDYRFVVGQGEYTLVEPAAQDGQFVYSRIISEFEDAAGVRSYADSETTEWFYSTSQPTNPSFTVDASGWGGGITRDTGSFNSSPASGLVPSAATAQTATLTTPLVVGRTYRLEAMVIGSSAGTITMGTAAPFGVIASSAVAISTSWALKTYEFTCTDPAEVPFVQWGGAVTTRIDDVALRELGGNVVAQRGFRRTALRPMTHRTTLATAQAVSDLELDAAQFPPFKGTITVSGRIPLKGGGHLDVAHLPGMTGENILIKNLQDPNTQALGRIGNITSAIYDHKTRRTMIGIDRDLKFISQIRDRLAIAQR